MLTMYDFHVHSRFSGDSEADLNKICETAIANGLAGICLTDHTDLCYPSDEVDFSFDYDSYTKTVLELKGTYGKHLDICKGIELGMQPCARQANRAYLQGKQFDFIIGSIHCIGEAELYQQKWLKGLTDRQGIKKYFEELSVCIEDVENSDVVGHLDVFRRYLWGSEREFCFADWREPIEAILRTLIAHHKGIELNTSTSYYGLEHFHPVPEILRLYRTLGGTIVTIGSDSHTPATLGNGFDQAAALLQSLGFQSYTIFHNRIPTQIKW